MNAATREQLSTRRAYPRLTGNETVEQLIQRGLSAKKIKARLGTDVTERQINRYGMKLLGPVEQNLSTEYALNELRPYIEACLEWLGRDPFWCECCEETQAKKCVIHHTRYAGCTLYDLAYICQSCNLARGNLGLN